MDKKIKILHLEDSLKDSELIHSIIENGEIGHDYFLTDNEKDYLNILKKRNIDLILADYNLPDYNGNEALKVAKEKYSHIPFIFVSGTIGEDAAITAMLNGAKDYVLKNKLERLVPAVKRALHENELEVMKKQAEEVLRESEERYRKSQKVGHIGSWEYDIKNDIFWGSDEGKRIYGLNLKSDNFTAEEVMNCVIDRDRVNQALINLIEKNETYNIVFDIIPLDSSEKRTINSIAELVRNEDGNPVKVTGVMHDITLRKQAEEELLSAKEKAEESDRLKSAFLANMSHEIRTPMNGILGFAELLKEPKLTCEEQQEYLTIIEKSGTRMLNIINDIVSISKVESGQVETFISETNLNEQIKFIYTFFKPEVEPRGIEFSFKNSLPDEEAIVKTDREKIYAILTNLVKNAIKFTIAGSIEFGYEKKGKYFEFFVKDTGIGIRQEQMEIIFERFRQGNDSLTRNYEGAGLGLAISKAYVEILGGKIWVESVYGKGSIVYFTIPCNPESEEKNVIQDIIPDEGKVNQIKNLKILIAEDDETSEMLLRMAIKRYCKEILTVRTGVEAIEACRNNPDIDLILMDVKMPEMDGFTAARQIRKFNKEVIIIAQTAFGLAGDREKAINAGCNEYIPKPFNKASFILLLKSILKTRKS